MTTSAKLTAINIVDLKGQIKLLHDHYEMLERGEEVSVVELLDSPSLYQIKIFLTQIPPRLRPDLDAGEIARRDHFIQQHVVTELLYDVEKSKGPLERAAAYRSLASALKKYDVTPKQYLDHCYLDDGAYVSQAQIFKDGAITYFHEALRTVFETAALSDTDAGLLRNENAPANERLNALLRPLTAEYARQFLDVLEQAMQSTDKEPELSDYVDALMPDNVFLNAPEEEAAVVLNERDERARKAIEKAVARVARSANTQDKVAAYEDLRAAMNMHRKDFDWFIATLRHEQSRERAREIIQEAALAYVNVNIMPSPEDQLLVDSAGARPNDQLNALFRNVANAAALDLLGALEEAGFDYEEAGLTQRILMAGVPLQPQGQTSQPS